jgi:N-formylglutamate deformylase
MANDRQAVDGNPAGDAVYDALCRQPFQLFRPRAQTVPFVFSSPHSGRAYPKAFVAQSRLSLTDLRRSEDAFVDELFSPVLACGAPLLAASFPRAFLDVNRGPTELDATMFDQSLPFAVDAQSPRVHAGLGVIPRIVRDGMEIYRGRLAATEAGERLLRFYRPYHAALAQLVSETYGRFGVAIVVDCHSMPSAAAAPDIVLGDRYGVSAAPQLVRRGMDAFERQGFSVARNVPYAGGYTTQLHGRPGRAHHALQIEINRALYLDEDRIAPKEQFALLRERLACGLRTLLALDPAILNPHAVRHAAE